MKPSGSAAAEGHGFDARETLRRVGRLELPAAPVQGERREDARVLARGLLHSSGSSSRP